MGKSKKGDPTPDEILAFLGEETQEGRDFFAEMHPAPKAATPVGEDFFEARGLTLVIGSPQKKARAKKA